jgi:hypothetical protein
MTAHTPSPNCIEAGSTTEYHEARREWLLNALPPNITDEYLGTCDRGDLEHIDGDYDELLEQVFVSFLYDEDADNLCSECDLPLWAHDVEERATYSGLEVTVRCPS